MPSLTPALMGMLSAGVLSSSLGLPLHPAQAQGGITSPAPGVICDQAGPTCYDRQGPSVGLTQTYFGSIAANRLTGELRNRPTTNDFRLSNGFVCDLRASSCWKDGWQKTQLAPKLTQQLFGTRPPTGNGSGNDLQGLQVPRTGVVCDSGSQLCYDQMGLSLGLTREYFGSYAEQAAVRNLGGQVPARQFRLSNGSACDGMARTCWSDGLGRQRVNLALTNQLFGGGGAGTQAQLGQCKLSRWFKTLFSGSCELRETRSNKGRLLEVSLQNGNVYTISRPRSGSYQISDRNGAVWPLQVHDKGGTTNFIWSDRLLTVTTRSATGSGLNLGQMIDSLLGQ